MKDLLYLTQEEFSAALKGRSVKRAKRLGLLRNAVAALAGRDDAEAIAALEHAMNDPEELVKGGGALGFGAHECTIFLGSIHRTRPEYILVNCQLIPLDTNIRW